ncbi:hypothetical protein LguiA_031881 [Lonicera macranthoides]
MHTEKLLFNLLSADGLDPSLKEVLEKFLRNLFMKLEPHKQEKAEMFGVRSNFQSHKIIILASSLLPETLTLNHRLNSFESSVGLSQKAFRLGKFVQEINSLRISKFDSNQLIALSLLAYLGEGTYYFVEQFFWLAKSRLIDAKYSRKFGRISAWVELIGYVGRMGLKIKDLKGILEDERCLVASIKISVMRGCV